MTHGGGTRGAVATDQRNCKHTGTARGSIGLSRARTGLGRHRSALGQLLKALLVFMHSPLCDIPSGCCFFTAPWTVTRSSLRMLRRVAAFCRPLRPVLLLVSFPRLRNPVVGVLGLWWMWHGMPFARQRRSPPSNAGPCCTPTLGTISSMLRACRDVGLPENEGPPSRPRNEESGVAGGERDRTSPSGSSHCMTRELWSSKMCTTTTPATPNPPIPVPNRKINSAADRKGGSVL